MRRRAFTLLEAILALVILGAAFVAALQVRVQLLAGVRDLAQEQRAHRLHDSLFRELQAGTIAGGDVIDGVLVYAGEHLGEAYRIEARMTEVENPLVGRVGYAVSPRVAIRAYVVEIGGERVEFLWDGR